MTDPRHDARGEGTSKRTEFHGPAAAQDGDHGIQNNHFHAPTPSIAAVPWSDVATSVKKGLVGLIVLGLLGGGAWWAYDYVQKNNATRAANVQKIDATRAACKQAIDAFYNDMYTSHDMGKTRYAQQLNEAARTVKDPKIARGLRYHAEDLKAYGTAYERRDLDAMSDANEAAESDRDIWWSPCWDATR